MTPNNDPKTPQPARFVSGETDTRTLGSGGSRQPSVQKFVEDPSASARALELATPANSELIHLAESNPPAQSWFDDEADPFSVQNPGQA